MLHKSELPNLSKQNMYLQNAPQRA